MSVIRQKIERTVVEDGPPIVVCDQCAAREQVVFEFAMPHLPSPWLTLASATRKADLCSWRCLETYAGSHHLTPAD